MTEFREALLYRILSQPSAPFRESSVIRVITETLKSHSVPHFLDPHGNIVVGVSSPKEYHKLIRLKSTEPVRVFVAHMDHPGFHGVKWKSPTELLIQWHGGSPTQHLENTKVWLAHSSPKSPTVWQGEGILKNVKLIPSGKAIQEGMVVFTESVPEFEPSRIFGGFGFRSPYWNEGDLIYTKAADDLVGAFAITSLALDLKKKKRPWIGLLTRAEEVGFVGALGHLELGWLKQTNRPIIFVSLETSRTLPGAQIGKGPVVRLGDRFTVFDPGALRVLSDLAESVLPEKHQKKIMDGGSCEATAATAYGFASVGISIPLGNYHNQSLEGGPDAAPLNGPAPEFVHIQDVRGLLELCQALLKPKLPWSKPWEKKKKELKTLIKEYRKLLQSEP